jgi:hypothetical protein
MQKNKQALKKMRNENAVIAAWIVALYSLLKLRKKALNPFLKAGDVIPASCN